jgi:hypothetical protein
VQINDAVGAVYVMQFGVVTGDVCARDNDVVVGRPPDSYCPGRLSRAFGYFAAHYWPVQRMAESYYAFGVDLDLAYQSPVREGAVRAAAID